jgi:(p)ppGpp synthase/HD superfamily hydrolase
MTDLYYQIRDLPLKEMDGALLSSVIRHHAQQEGWNEFKVNKALDMAAYLHRNQTRANRGEMPRTHYIEHPYRNALRLIRYGCLEEDLIIAAILHDTVEDCFSELLALTGDFSTPASMTGIDHCFAFYDLTFGTRASAAIRSVTNTPDDGVKRSRAEKRALYVQHVTAALQSPDAALVKLVDFIDNGAGLHHNDVSVNRGMVSHLAQKYLPLVPVFMSRVRKSDIQDLLSDEGYNKVLLQLDTAGKTLLELSYLR